MNRNIGFGCRIIGNYATVKVNVKLDESLKLRLEKEYNTWLSFIDNGKFGYRIEGVLPFESVGKFFRYDLKRAMYLTEALKTSAKITALDKEWTPEETCWTKANLNEI